MIKGGFPVPILTVSLFWVNSEKILSDRQTH